MAGSDKDAFKDFIYRRQEEAVSTAAIAVTHHVVEEACG